LGRVREDTQPAKLFWNGNVFPGNLALAAIARFRASPKEGTPPFINCLNYSRREKAGSHCVGNHGCENGIIEKQSAIDRERAAPPTKEAHVTLGDDRREIRELKFVGGKWKTEVNHRD
jgi:hypothetical protein